MGSAGNPPTSSSIRSPSAILHQSIVMVVLVHHPCQNQLSLAIQASNLVRCGLGFRKSRKKHACKNGYDRNHHQEFNQRKPFWFRWIPLRPEEHDRSLADLQKISKLARLLWFDLESVRI